MPTLHHLIDDTHPAAPAVLASVVFNLPEAEHRIGVRGGTAVRRTLEAMGLRCAATSGRLPAKDAGRVVAWSPRCALAAALRGRPVWWVAFDADDHDWRRRLLRLGRTTTLSLTATDYHFRGRVEPAFDPRLLGARNGHDWQRRDDDRVIALLADDPRRVDAAAAGLAIAIADEANRGQPRAPRLRLLIHPDADHAARARTLTDDGDTPHRLLVDPDMARPWDLLPGCDAAILWGTHTHLAAGWVAAAGLPVIVADADKPDPRALAVQLRSLAAAALPAPAPLDLPLWRQLLT